MGIQLQIVVFSLVQLKSIFSYWNSNHFWFDPGHNGNLADSFEYNLHNFHIMGYGMTKFTVAKGIPSTRSCQYSSGMGPLLIKGHVILVMLPLHHILLPLRMPQPSWPNASSPHPHHNTLQLPETQIPRLLSQLYEWDEKDNGCVNIRQSREFAGWGIGQREVAVVSR